MPHPSSPAPVAPSRPRRLLAALPRRLARAAAAVACLAAASACGTLGDVLSPGRPAAGAPARLALAATIPAFQQGSAPAELRVVAAYERLDGSTVPLPAPAPIPLGDARTQQAEIALELGPCLADAQRRRPAGSDEGGCVVRVTMTLVVGGRVVDEQTLPALTLQPGGKTEAPAPVTLFEIRTVRIVLPAGATARADGSVRLEVGSALALGVAALDAGGQPVAGRPVRWTSSVPATASVTETGGAVSAVAPGRARVTAVVGGREAALDLEVVPRPSPIAVTLAGSGAGSVTSDPAGLDCRRTGGANAGACAATFPGDASVRLTALATGGARFGGWTGDCASAGTAPVCVVSAAAARAVGATFVQFRRLTVEGIGVGSVASTPAGIACAVGSATPGACAFEFAEGTVVALVATAGAGQNFVAWDGDCAGADPQRCSVTLTGGDRIVRPIFGAPQTLGVGIGGTGGGSVGGGGIACSRAAPPPGSTTAPPTTGTCSTVVPFGTTVSLTASPDAQSTFTGWSGACSGTDACLVTLDRAQGVGATFTRRQATVTIALSGAGAGSVGGGAVGCSIAAGQGSNACTARVDVGTVLSLGATPAPGNDFAGWSGACSGTGACTLTVTGDVGIGASFVPRPVAVSVGASPLSTGSGSVQLGVPNLPPCVISPTGTSGGCSATVPVGSRLVVGAAAASGSTFEAWGGDCTAATGDTCTITVPARPVGISVRFGQQAGTVSVRRTAGYLGGGSITSTDNRISCTIGVPTGTLGGTCDAQVPAGTRMTFNFSPEPNSIVGAITGCTPTGPTSCVLDVVPGPNAVTVAFAFGTTVSLDASGAGTITMQAPGQPLRTCSFSPPSSSCDYPAFEGQSVTFTAAGEAVGGFRQWSGGTTLCSGTSPTCTVQLPPGRFTNTAAAQFDFAVRVAMSGPGGGTVTVVGVAPPTNTCTLPYAGASVTCVLRAPTASVQLQAQSATGSFFAGFGAGCPAFSSTCTVNVVSQPNVGVGFGSNTPVSVSAGEAHACAVTGNGSIVCWGANGSGQIGDGTTTNRSSPTFADTPAGEIFVEVAAGFAHTCARAASGTVWCWGSNGASQLGNPTGTPNIPRQVLGIPAMAGIAVGGDISCGVAAATGRLWCWGDMTWDGGTRSPQVRFGAGNTFQPFGVATSLAHQCYVTPAGAVQCSGFNASGQLAQPLTFPLIGTPSALALQNLVASPGTLLLRQVAVGFNGGTTGHSCAISGGALYCWGEANLGAIGVSGNFNRPTPTQTTVPNPIGVAAGRGTTCALVSGGAVYCFGSDGAMLNGSGTGSGTPSSGPLLVGGGLPALRSITAGNTFGCGLSAVDARVWCWGNNGVGQTGNGSPSGVAAPQGITIPLAVP